jgi:hypothetical protein
LRVTRRWPARLSLAAREAPPPLLLSTSPQEPPPLAPAPRAVTAPTGHTSVSLSRSPRHGARPVSLSGPAVHAPLPSTAHLCALSARPRHHPLGVSLHSSISPAPHLLVAGGKRTCGLWGCASGRVAEVGRGGGSVTAAPFAGHGRAGLWVSAGLWRASPA